MQNFISKKSIFLAGFLVLTLILSWEFYLRHRGIEADFDDNAELWANKRAMVYEPSDKATVFIGSSRIKYDLDIPTWEKSTGNHAVQLATVGSSPRLILSNLAKDQKFKGRLVVDITEILFFSLNPKFTKRPSDGIEFYKKRTPAQLASNFFGSPLQSSFVFLNEEFFSLNALLARFHLKDRVGILPPMDFPFGFGLTQSNRQTKMSANFVADTNLQNRVKAVWYGLSKANPTPPIKGKSLDSLIQTVRMDVDKIRARGGKVIFIRTPSSGPFLMGENIGYPRNLYWEKLLLVTNCKGVYFADYPATAHFQCPEFSHLKPQDAILYTQNLIQILGSENGWKL